MFPRPSLPIIPKTNLSTPKLQSQEVTQAISVTGLPRLDYVADGELSVVLDIAQVYGEILTAGLAVRVALVADGDGLAGDGIAADGKVTWEDLEDVSCVHVFAS